MVAAIFQLESCCGGGVGVGGGSVDHGGRGGGLLAGGGGPAIEAKLVAASNVVKGERVLLSVGSCWLVSVGVGGGGASAGLS